MLKFISLIENLFLFQLIKVSNAYVESILESFISEIVSIINNMKKVLILFSKGSKYKSK